jgi:hypothetical protein
MKELLMLVDQPIINYTAILLTIYTLLLVTFIFINLNIYIKNKPRLDRYSIDIRMEYTPEDFDLLDLIIEKFMTNHLIQEGVSLMEYITTDQETELCKSLVEDISMSMSPALLTRLTKVYNQDALSTIIANRAYIHLNNYVIQHNSLRKK